MTRRITDRDMLIRTLSLLEGSRCCEFFACPGGNHRPVGMASCANSSAQWDLRQYMQRHGGWCPEHEQDLGKCHPDAGTYRCPDGNPICHCHPVNRTKDTT